MGHLSPMRIMVTGSCCVLWGCHSPPEKLEDMAEELSWRDLSDDNLQPESIKLGSRWSISTLVKTMCSLSHMAEDNFEIPGTKRLFETLAENDILYERKITYVIGQMENHPKIFSTKRSAHRLILPPFPLKRRWSELALPTFVTTEEGNQGQEGDGVKALDTSKETSASLGVTSERTHVEAETGRTITFSHTTLDVLYFLEDTTCQKYHGPPDDAGIMEETTNMDLNDSISQTTSDLMFTVSPPQHGSSQYETVKDLISRESPSTSANEQPQEVPIASNRHRRRGWKGLRRQAQNLFRRLCFCLPTPRRGGTASRAEDEAQARGS
ncbi:uncharacterized protein LOC102928988 isoform X1 [Peromyscus maniculatus bairdii]|uniref:uncharacterized protein LOC102928988 isoform X1 n=2 Tax=Peromyscus maniculatus bairdii TaxID=230844 RepID=UPI00077DA3AD|nr:uncharacterized protein LOC102928988 isoform X1 [Peromyscus maniculatus bairdii]XP_042114979.1 uncharacterized protein LOC102928988 isoform X1 [Peromyscus maniculatus bairdii]